MPKDESTGFTYTPIGVVHTPYTSSWAPNQPVEREVERGSFFIELDEELAAGLDRLDLFAYIYVFTALHKSQPSREMIVSPPWAGGAKAGVFATRSPARPNPIGLHVVKLRAIEGATLHIWPIDVFDGTPVLDIKPYIRDLDSKEDADYGWLSTFEGVRHLLEHMRGIPHEHDHDHDHGHDHAHGEGGDHHHHGDGAHTHAHGDETHHHHGDVAHDHEGGDEAHHHHGDEAHDHEGGDKPHKHEGE